MHKPEKNEVEAKLFYDKILEWGETEEIEIQDGVNVKRMRYRAKSDQNKEIIHWSGFVFPPIPDDYLPRNLSIFEDSVFESPLHLSNVIFEGNISFARTTIKHGEKNRVRCSNSAFLGEADFSGATFNSKADFSGTSFKEEAKFEYAQFEKHADFNNAKFDKRAIFKNAKFHDDLWMFGISFGEKSNFKETLFGKSVTFNETTFSGVADFAGAVFLQNLSLRNSDFRQGLNLVSIEEIENNVKYFERYSVNEKVITDVGKIISNSDILEELREFDHQCWKDVDKSIKIKYKKKNDTKSLNLSGRETNRVFRCPSNFLNNHNITPEDLELIEVRVDKFHTNQAKTEGYRLQKISFTEEGKREESDKVFAREMAVRRNKRLEDAKAKLLNNITSEINIKGIPKYIADAVWAFLGLSLILLEWVFEWLLVDQTCKYGASWIRIITFSIFTILSFSVFYKAGYYLQYGSIIQLGFMPSEYEPIEAFGNFIYYSVVTFTTLGYGDLQPIGAYMKAWSSIESFTGAFFMALLVLVFGRKWLGNS